MPPNSGQRVQLHRALSKLGICSRTVAWGRIAAGEIRVNGRVVRDPLTWVDLKRDQISSIQQPELSNPPRKQIVLALHKPRGYVTTRSDERGRKTVYDLLPDGLPWIFPAGRLDADSEGLLIMTNDSSLSHRLTDPESHSPKTYLVTVSGQPAAEVIQKLRSGISLHDGLTRPAEVRCIEENSGASVLEIVLTEGRNRQIRRMCDAVGHPVKRLVRTAIGRFTIGLLGAGEIYELSEREIELLTVRGAVKSPDEH